MSIVFALYCSLTTGLSITNLLEPLVFTKRSDTPSKALSRYVYTFLHIGLWHTGDVWNPEEQAAKSVQMVRCMHTKVAKQMNAAVQCGKLFISQYDMALVQCGFMGAVIMYPQSFGISCCVEELEDYTFFWRGIGFLLGIEDKYNMCCGNYQETLTICKEIERKILLPSLRNPPPEFPRMVDAYIEGTNMRRRVLSFSPNSVVAFSLSAMGQSYPALSVKDTVRLCWLKCIAFLIRWCPLFARLNNSFILNGVNQFAYVLFKDNTKKES
jgi:hypothetical protein